MLDQLQVSVDDVRRRQLAALRADVPEAFDGHRRRLAAATLTGLTIMGALTDNAPHLRDLVTDVVSIAERDPRFAFLNAIPEGPVLSMSRALALERAIYGQETDAVARLSLLMGMFTLILDGLLDEAPEALVPIRGWLDTIMDPANWQPGTRPPAPELTGHPVTDALGWLTVETIASLVAQDGWKSDRVVREQFAAATRAAYGSELSSISCRMTEPGVVAGDVRQRILAKSTNPIWAGSLIPFCVHGWPEGINPGRFAGLAREIGRFGGWVDDIIDIAADLRADRWSMALIELYDAAGQLLPRQNGGDPRIAITGILQFPFVTERLIYLGSERLGCVRAGLAENGLAEAGILPALADVAIACLSDGLSSVEA